MWRFCPQMFCQMSHSNCPTNTKWTKCPNQKAACLRPLHESMGGVDRADQLRSSYTVSGQSRKWYRYIFWFVFNVAACNTYILECEHRLRNHQRTRPQTDFRLELGKRLINGYTYRKRPAPSQAPQARRDHQAVRLEERKRECVLCKTTGRKTPEEYPVEMKNKCQECGVALCKVRCFVEYHSTDA